MERATPHGLLSEREMLVAWLEFQRATFVSKLAGLAPDQLRQRSTPPSNLSLLGLLRHHTDGEVLLFRGCLLGDDVDDVLAEPGTEFEDLGSVDVDVALAAWQTAVDASRAALAATSDLDQRCAADLEPGVPINVRWLLVHMIEEYARHNGHADLLREAIDGSTGY